MLAAVGADEIWGAIALVGGVGSIAFLMWMARGDKDREAEEAAREYFDRHGRWPDED